MPFPVPCDKAFRLSVSERYIEEAFLNGAEVLLDGLPNKGTIISRIKDPPLAARTVQKRITEMTENVHIQQTVALTNAPVFSAAVDERVDIDDFPHLAVG